MTRPLGLLAFTNFKTGDMEAVEVTEIIRITDLRSAKPDQARSRVHLRNGTEIDSGSCADLLYKFYLDTIHGRAPLAGNSSGYIG